MRAVVQALALLVPVLGGAGDLCALAAGGAYGWTPTRLMAATLAGMRLLYGLAYGGPSLCAATGRPHPRREHPHGAGEPRL